MDQVRIEVLQKRLNRTKENHAKLTIDLETWKANGTYEKTLNIWRGVLANYESKIVRTTQQLKELGAL